MTAKNKERRDLALICFFGTVFFVVSSMLFGCTRAVKRCPPAPKCPPSYAELFGKSEVESDRLEMALAGAEERYLACEENWKRVQRKGR